MLVQVQPANLHNLSTAFGTRFSMNPKLQQLQRVRADAQFYESLPGAQTHGISPLKVEINQHVYIQRDKGDLYIYINFQHTNQVPLVFHKGVISSALLVYYPPATGVDMDIWLSANSSRHVSLNQDVHIYFSVLAPDTEIREKDVITLQLKHVQKSFAVWSVYIGYDGISVWFIK